MIKKRFISDGVEYSYRYKESTGRVITDDINKKDGKILFWLQTSGREIIELSRKEALLLAEAIREMDEFLKTKE